MGGGIFMEGKTDMTSQQPERPQNIAGKTLNPPEGHIMASTRDKHGRKSTNLVIPQKPVSQERQDKTKELWEKYYLEPQGKTWESLPFDDKQTIVNAIEYGRPPSVAGGADPIPNVLSYRDSTLYNIAIRVTDQINSGGPGRPLDIGYVEGQLGEVNRLVNSGAVDVDEARRLIGVLEGFRTESIEAERLRQQEERRAASEGGSYRLYLEQIDLDELSEDPLGWLNRQYDLIYDNVKSSQDLNRPIVSGIQNQITYAILFLRHQNPESLTEFQEINQYRFELIKMRAVIGYRNIEAVQQQANSLTTHGLLYGLSMEGGKVRYIFNRMNDVLEDIRLREGREMKHVDPAMIARLQEELISKEIELVNKGISQFGDLREESLSGLSDEDKTKKQDQIRSDIVRAVRTAYDVFVSSQRQAIIVSRGRRLTGNDAYFSDPIGPLNVYNIEDFTYEKWDIYNLHDQEFTEKLRRDYVGGYIVNKKREYEKVRTKKDPTEWDKWGSIEIEILESLTEEEKEKLGRLLFKDLFAVPDLFSAGWRVQGILDALKLRFGDKADDLGLFLRLKDASTDKEKRAKAWEKIADYRPEEVIRIFRDKAVEYKDLGVELKTLFEKDAFAEFRRLDKNNAIDPLKTFDAIKEKWGPLIGLLRERGYRELRQINIGQANLKEDDLRPEKDTIQKFLGDGDDVVEKFQNAFREMRVFARDKIRDLVINPKFYDIYTRTRLVDDAMLDLLEASTRDAEGNPYIPLSQVYSTSSESAGDALVRTWGDTGDAIKGSQKLLGFIKTESFDERVKSAIEFADFISNYSGQSKRAEIVRYTVGTLFNLSKKDYLWEALDIDKLPLRMPMSDIERIYGPTARPVGRDELRDQLDKVRIYLTSEIEKKFRDMPPQERDNNPDYKEAVEKADRAYRDLEVLLEVSAFDKTKLSILRFLLYFFLAAGGETIRTGKEALTAK